MVTNAARNILKPSLKKIQILLATVLLLPMVQYLQAKFEILPQPTIIKGAAHTCKSRSHVFKNCKKNNTSIKSPIIHKPL